MTDTLKSSKALTASGIPSDQAEAITTVIAESVASGSATKEDIARMDGRINTMDMKLNVVLGLLLIVLGKLFFR